MFDVRWKLHLRPAHLPLIANLELPSLPPYVTSVDVVLADFLGYIQKCVRDFIITSHGGGDQIWAALYPSMHVILTTPNGWEGAQQKRMRTAAYTARLVDGNGGQRVHFVTEAEVRMHIDIVPECRAEPGMEIGCLPICCRLWMRGRLGEGRPSICVRNAFVTLILRILRLMLNSSCVTVAVNDVSSD
jgi:hypothetical protein